MVELNRSYPFLAPLLYHLVSGGAFFTGAGLVLLSAALSFVRCHRFVGMTIRLVAVLGAGVVAVSSTPFAAAVYLAGTIILAAWLVIEERQASINTVLVRCVRCLLIAFALTGTLIELRMQAVRPLCAQQCDALYVLGDSISAGTEDDQLTWPTILARAHSVEVVNLSRPGAQVGSILPQADMIEAGHCLVLLEIGGNDLLNKIGISPFESGLRSLLEAVCGPTRTVAMLELPLPPLCAGYGRAQRCLAKEFGVALVPKRVFAKILASRGNTTDGLHLSEQGHRKMADAIWRVIGSAMGGRDS